MIFPRSKPKRRPSSLVWNRTWVPTSLVSHWRSSMETIHFGGWRAQVWPIPYLIYLMLRLQGSQPPEGSDVGIAMKQHKEKKIPTRIGILLQTNLSKWNPCLYRILEVVSFPWKIVILSCVCPFKSSFFQLSSHLRPSCGTPKVIVSIFRCPRNQAPQRGNGTILKKRSRPERRRWPKRKRCSRAEQITSRKCCSHCPNCIWKFQVEHVSS